MNDYDNQKTDTVDIPDFVEEKEDTDSSVDMSIFKMSDDELYDDAPKSENKNSQGKKKSNSTLVLCLVLICILLVTSAVGIIYSLKEHKKVSSLNDEITQLKATNNDLQTKIGTLNSEKEALEAKLKEKENAGTSSDPNNKYPSGTTLWITEDGSTQGVRVTASKDAETAVDSEGNMIVLYWGDKVVLTADATVDSNGTYWGKIDTGFIRIETNGEVWASTEQQ